jgi:hypothetical protein
LAFGVCERPGGLVAWVGVLPWGLWPLGVGCAGGAAGLLGLAGVVRGLGEGALDLGSYGELRVMRAGLGCWSDLVC